MGEHEHPIVVGYLVGSVMVTSLAEHLVGVLGGPEACECSRGLVHARAWLAERFEPEAVEALAEVFENSGATCDHRLVGRLAADLAHIANDMMDSDIRVVEVRRGPIAPTREQLAAVAAVLAEVADG